MRHAAQGDEQGARRVEKVGAQLELYSVEHPGELQFQVGEARVACVVAALGLGAEARGSGGEPDQSARQSARGAAPPPPALRRDGPRRTLPRRENGAKKDGREHDGDGDGNAKLEEAAAGCNLLGRE